MKAFIRNPRTFKLEKTYELISYNIPVSSDVSEKGTVTMLGDYERDYSHHLMTFDEIEGIYQISAKCTETNKQITADIVDAVNVHQYTMKAKQSTGTFADNMANNYMPFSIYRLSTSYFRPDGLCSKTNLATGSIRAKLQTLTPTDDDICADDSEGTAIYYPKLITYLRKNGISVEYKIYDKRYNASTVIPTFEFKLDIAQENPAVIYFGDGHTELLSAKFNDDICSSVIFNGTITYYLCEDGTITYSPSTSPQRNGYGRFAYLAGAGQDQQTYNAAAEIFAQNKENYQIEFASDYDYDVHQQVKLMLPSGVLDCRIDKIAYLSTDNRKHYYCGDEPITATQQMNSNAWTYGSRLPSNPKNGQLHFVIA